MWIFPALLVCATAIVGGLFIVDGYRRTRARRDEVDDLEAARRRLVAAGEDPDAPHVFTAGSTVYTSRHAVITGTDHPVTVIESLADDVAEHVEHGAGSITSLAATIDDTRMRTSVQLRELEVAENEAYDEAPAQEERIYYAAFELRWQAMLTDFEVGTRAVRRVNAEHHASVGEHTCTLCMVGVQEISDEFQQIVIRVEAQHTGEISRADIDAMYALHGATT